MLAFQQMGVPTLDYGNNIRQVAFDEGVHNAFDFPASCRPTSVCCSAAARARSAGWRYPGDPEDIYKTDAKMKELFPEDKCAASLARHGARPHCVPGPARADLLGRASDER